MTGQAHSFFSQSMFQGEFTLSHNFGESALKKTSEFWKLWLRDYPVLLSVFWILTKQENSQSSTTLHGSSERASAPSATGTCTPGGMAGWPSREKETAGRELWLPPPLPPLPHSPLPPPVAGITAINIFSNHLPKQQALCFLRDGKAKAEILKLFITSPRCCHKGILLFHDLCVQCRKFPHQENVKTHPLRVTGNNVTVNKCHTWHELHTHEGRPLSSPCRIRAHCVTAQECWWESKCTDSKLFTFISS